MPAENVVERSRAEYLNNLWWVMHHSDSPNRATMALAFYHDDSAAGDGSPITAIGGPVMSRDAFIAFDRKWSRLLDLYQIPQPLHMTDFARPFGKHAGMREEMKIALFSEAASLINGHKSFSVSVGIPQPDFKLTLSGDVREQLLSPCGLAFFRAVMTNQGVCKNSVTIRHEVISYLVDDGSNCKHQLKDAHTAIVESGKSRGQFGNTGAMAFDTDDRVSALQAAGVIAWSARRRGIDGQLEDEFEPLEAVLAREGRHQHVSIPLEGIEEFGQAPINISDPEAFWQQSESRLKT